MVQQILLPPVDFVTVGAGQLLCAAGGLLDLEVDRSVMAGHVPPVSEASLTHRTLVPLPS